MIQEVRLPGLSVVLSLSANTKQSCALLMAHANKVIICTHIAVSDKLSIYMGTFLH